MVSYRKLPNEMRGNTDFTGDITFSGNVQIASVDVAGDLALGAVNATSIALGNIANTVTTDIYGATVNIGQVGGTVNILGAVNNINATDVYVPNDLEVDGIIYADGGIARATAAVLSIGGGLTTGIDLEKPTNGFGILPIGSVIALMTNMTGAYACAATTAADDNGFVLCNGQTIADANSPMNGQVVPNLNDDVFLMGSAGASGSPGGSNTKDLSHTHSVTSNVAVGNHASHTHQVTTNVTVSDHASHTHSVTSNVSVATHASHTHSVTSNVAVASHTIATANLPSHSHTIDHGHANTLAVANYGDGSPNTASVMNSTHSHGSGTLASAWTVSGGLVRWLISSQPFNGDAASTAAIGYTPQSPTAYADCVDVFGDTAGANSGGTTTVITDIGHGHSMTGSVTNYAGNSGSTGSGTALAHSVTNNAVTSENESAALSHSVTNNAVTSGDPSATLSHTVGNGTVTSANESAVLTHSVTNNAVTSGSSLSSTFDVRPKYITCKYIMRIV